MKTAQLLQTLNDQLSELAALVAPLAEHATLSPRFDRQLFPHPQHADAGLSGGSPTQL